jgi:CBS domain-containing protein
MGPAVVVHEQTTLRDVACLMLQQQVQGVIVVNAHAGVVGIVTERQLTLNGRYLQLACLEVPEIGGRAVTAREEVDAACIAATTVQARDIMERCVTSASADEPVGAAVERMLRREAEFAVVYRGSAVVGMLGSHDLLRKVAGEPTFVRPLTETLCMNGQTVHIAAQGQTRSLFSRFVAVWR